MRTTSLIAATALASMLLASATAFAGEANFEPFPSQVQFPSVSVGGYAQTGSQAYAANGPVFAGFNGIATLPQVGQQSMVASVNSVPNNFDVGTVQYADAQATNRWFAQQADHRFTARSQHVTPRG